MPVTATAICAREWGERAGRHRACDLAAHRAMRGDELGGHAERFALGRIRIGDEAALEPFARTGERGARGGDHSAGA